MRQNVFPLDTHTKLLTEMIDIVITALKRSLRKLCFYTCLSFCSQGGGWYPSSLANLQAHTKGGGLGVWLGGFPGPQQGGRLRGLARGFSTPTAMVVSRATPGGVVCVCPSMYWGRPPPPPADGYCNAFLFLGRNY